MISNQNKFIQEWIPNVTREVIRYENFVVIIPVLIPTQDEISGTEGPWNFVQVGL